MSGGDEPNISDVAYSEKAAEMVESKEQLNSQDIEQAVRSVITAAAEARAREFIKSGTVVAPEDVPPDRKFEEYQSYIDRATGELWLDFGDNIFGIYETPTSRTGGVRKYYPSGDPTKPEESQYEWIREKFTYFGDRWPVYPQTMAQHCNSGKDAILSGQMTPIVSVKDAVMWWSGKARDNFKDYFLNPYMMNAVTNQQTLLDELAVAMYAYEGILKQGRIDAKSIADDAVKHLDALNVGSGTDWKVILGVVGVVVAVVSTVATAGTTTALTLGLIGASVSAMSLIPSEQTVEGAYTDDVMESIDDVLTAIREAMEYEEQLLADQLKISSSSVKGYLGSSDPLNVATVLPNEPTGDSVPNLTEGEVPNPRDFHPRD